MSHSVRGLLILTLPFALVSGCGGSGKEPKTLPSQTVSQSRPALETPPPLPPPVRAPQSPAPVQILKVIDPGHDPRPKSLVEASRLAKAHKAKSPPPVIVITDENLAAQSEGGQITIMTSEPAAPALIDPDLEARSDEDATRDESYWRRRGLSIRRSWRESIDTIDRLELEAASLRQQFYAQDDPYVRDNRIKPAWDRALDRVGELREEALLYEEALDDYVEEGRQEGIPPGWLNDGWELEPNEAELEQLEAGIRIQRPVNPPEVEEPVRDIDASGGGR